MKFSIQGQKKVEIERELIFDLEIDKKGRLQLLCRSSGKGCDDFIYTVLSIDPNTRDIDRWGVASSLGLNTDLNGRIKINDKD